MGTPERPDDNFVFVERVIEMAGDFANVNATKASDARLRIERPGSGQQSQDPERLFKLSDEYLRVDSILKPPFFSRRTCRRAVAVNLTRRGVNVIGVP